MTQEYLILEPPEIQSSEEIHEALILCKKCQHIVPKTMLCLYCGEPILYRHPTQE